MILTVDEVKAHLRIEDDDEDAYLESLIRQGQAVAEDYCRVTFETDTVAQPVRLAVLLLSATTTRTATSPSAAYTTP